MIRCMGISRCLAADMLPPLAPTHPHPPCAVDVNTEVLMPAAANVHFSQGDIVSLLIALWGDCSPLNYNNSHWNEVLPQNNMHFIQRPCYQRGSSCQVPAGSWTTWKPRDHHKETQTAVVWSCLPFIRSGQKHLARHNEREKKTRPTEKEAGRQHQGMDRPEVRQVPEGSGEQGKWRKLIVKSSVVPQPPSQSRDRWWWWWWWWW